MAEQERRLPDNVRLAIIEREVKDVLETVRDIDKALRFPENSALGRQLLDRAVVNANNIALNTSRIEAVEDRVTELQGVAKALRMAGLLIGIAIGIFSLIQVARPPL